MILLSLPLCLPNFSIYSFPMHQTWIHYTASQAGERERQSKLDDKYHKGNTMETAKNN